MPDSSYPPVAEESIQWVVMPAGFRQTGDGQPLAARLSILVAPRLGDPSSPRWRLGRQSLFHDWPSSLRSLLGCDPGAWRIPLIIETSNRRYCVLARVLPHAERDRTGTELWQRLFNEDTLVEPFGGPTGSIKAAHRAKPALLAYHPDRIEEIVRVRRVALLAAVMSQLHSRAESATLPDLLRNAAFTEVFRSARHTPDTVADAVAEFSKVGTGEEGSSKDAPSFVLGNADQEKTELARFHLFHSMPPQPMRPDVRFEAAPELPPNARIDRLPVARKTPEGTTYQVSTAPGEEAGVLPAPGDLVNAEARLLRVAPARTLVFKLVGGQWTVPVQAGAFTHATVQLGSGATRVKAAEVAARWAGPGNLVMILPPAKGRAAPDLVLESGADKVLLRIGADEGASEGDLPASSLTLGLNPGHELTFETVGGQNGAFRWRMSAVKIVLGPADLQRRISLEFPLLDVDDRPGERTVVLPTIPSVASGSGAEADVELALRNDVELALRNQVEAEVVVNAATGEPIARLGNREARVFRVEQGRWTTEAENVPDFHDALSAFSSYPEVRRTLGLLLDVEVTFEDLLRGCDGQAQQASDLFDAFGGRGKVRVDALAEAQPAHHLFPSTWYETAEVPRRAQRPRLLFYLLPRPGSGLSVDRGLVVNPVVERGPDGPRRRYRFVQEDADGAAFKVSYLAQELAANSAIEPDPAESLLPRPAASPQLPSGRQLGFNLVDTRLVGEAAEAIKRVSQLDGALMAAAGGDPAHELFADDLMLGVRVDVRRSRNGNVDRWRPLCGRVGKYWFGRIDRTTSRTAPDLVIADEGHVALGGDEHTDTTGSALRLSRTLFRWPGWGLCVERPSKGIDDDGEPDQRPDPGTRLNDQIPLEAHFEPPAAPVNGDPDLRFARLRFLSSYEFRARFVDVAGNSLGLDEADDAAPRNGVFDGGVFQRVEAVDAPVIIPLQEVKEGSTADQLVIRSYDDRATEWNRWLAAPPKISTEMAELAGVFDRLPTADAVLAAIVAREEGLPAWGPEPGSVPSLPGPAGEEPPRPGGFDRAWLDKHWDARRERFRFPYLPDPFSAGASLQIQDDASPVPHVLPFPGHASLGGFDLEAVQPVQIELRPGPWEVEACGSKVRFHLPKGETRKLRLSSLLRREDLGSVAQLDWLAAAEKRTARKASSLYFGQTPQVFDGTEKLAADGLVSPITPARELTLVHAVQRPLPGPADDTIHFDPPLRAASETIANLSGTVDIDVKSTGKVDFEGTWVDTVDDPGLPDWYDLNGKSQAFQMNVPSVSPDAFDFQGIHKFEDTKHRVVTYTVTGTSRFVDYYPARWVKEKPGDFIRQCKPMALSIPSSHSPADPAPYYIVPTYRREDGRKRKGEVTQLRKGGGLRIYMHRGWFSSGQGERLAVLLPTDDLAELPGELEDKVTRWAMDPIHRSAALPGRPLLQHFPDPAARVGRHPIVVTLENEPGTGCGNFKVLCKREILVGGKTTTVYDVQMEVAVAAYDVALDTAKGLLYCDVDIDLHGVPAYYPFIRLALARYQEDSIEPLLALSGVVRAEFCQPAPDRALTVKRSSHDGYEVTIAGTGFDALQPDWDADPSKPCAPPTMASPGISFEVTVEQATGVAALAGTPSAWKPIPGTTQVLTPKQIGPANWIWTGEVRPPRGILVRRRLVVREYERLASAHRLTGVYIHEV